MKGQPTFYKTSDLTLNQLAFLRATANSAWGVRAGTASADPRTVRSLQERGLIRLVNPAKPLWGQALSIPEAHWQPTRRALISPLWPNRQHPSL